MNKYKFNLDKELRVQASFSIFAETSDEAVSQANDSLSENDNQIEGTGIIDHDLPPAALVMHLETGFDAGMISSEAEVNNENLLTMHRFLEREGFEYEGDDEDIESDDELLFSKPVWTEDGRGVDAFLRVHGSISGDSDKPTYTIQAVFTPGGRQDSTAEATPCIVHLKARQYSMDEQDVQCNIKKYEKKFTEIIRILRMADLS